MFLAKVDPIFPNSQFFKLLLTHCMLIAHVKLSVEELWLGVFARTIQKNKNKKKFFYANVLGGTHPASSKKLSLRLQNNFLESGAVLHVVVPPPYQHARQHTLFWTSLWFGQVSDASSMPVYEYAHRCPLGR